MRLPKFVLDIVVARLVSAGFWRGPRLVPALAFTLAGYVAAVLWPQSGWALAGLTVVDSSLVVAALARSDQEGRRTVLASRPLVVLGTLSLPCYLIRLLAVQSAAAVLPPGSLSVLPSWSWAASTGETTFALVVAIGTAWVLHHVVEIPARALLLGQTSRKTLAVIGEDRGIVRLIGAALTSEPVRVAQLIFARGCDACCCGQFLVGLNLDQP